MKIEATLTKNQNYLLNVSNTVFLYVDKNKEYVLREISEKEYNIADAMWLNDYYSENISINDLSECVEKFIIDRYESYKIELKKFEENLKKVNFFQSSFYSIINNYEANYTMHEYSNANVSNPIALTDTEIHNLFKRFMNKELYIEEVISDIRWINNGNCVGDEIYPVIMKASLLGSGNYMIEINYKVDNSGIGYETDMYLYSVS